MLPRVSLRARYVRVCIYARDEGGMRRREKGGWGGRRGSGEGGRASNGVPHGRLLL